MAEEKTPSRRIPRRAVAIPASDENSYEPTSAGIDAGQEPEASASNSLFADEPVLETRRAARPAPDEAPDTDQTEDNEEVLTRRGRGGAADAKMDIPAEYKRPGWDYEYKTARVNGADVDDSEIAEIREAGWRPVLADKMPKLCSPGYTGKYVSRLGQILYTRPMHLTEEAREEDIRYAEQQKYEKLRTASDIKVPQSGMRSLAPKVEIVGEFGTYKPAAKAG